MYLCVSKKKVFRKNCINIISEWGKRKKKKRHQWPSHAVLNQTSVASLQFSHKTNVKCKQIQKPINSKHWTVDWNTLLQCTSHVGFYSLWKVKGAVPTLHVALPPHVITLVTLKNTKKISLEFSNFNQFQR